MNLIQQLAGIIEGNLNSPLSVNVLAERSGYSERWLYKLFQDVTGISVAQYIRRRKLTLAALLLRHTSRRITDISLMYEFSSPQAFSRAFRQQFKVSPVQYRNADAWDMQYAQPVLYRTTPCTKFRMIEIAEGNHPSVPNLKMPVNLGMDFIHTQNGDHFIYNRNLFESIISIYGPVNEMSDFMISGEMIPSRETDSELIYTFKEINSFSLPETLLPDGLYASQEFTGTYKEIFDFHIYDAMGSLCINKCVMKRGPIYTLFHRTDNKNIMDMQFLIPCVKI